MVDFKYLLNRLRVGLHNKRWLLNRRWYEFQMKLQFRWIAYSHSQVREVNDKSALIFAPHQDDESLGCAGIIALKREQGIRVKVVFITDGGGSHSGHPTITREEIVQIRRVEALAALNILGVEPTDIHFLNQRDGALHKQTETERQQTIDKMAGILSEFQPGEVYITHRQDRSRDHETSYKLMTEALAQAKLTVEVWEYAIWLLWNSLLGRNLTKKELAGAYRLSIDSVVSKKRQALETYRSQYLPIDAGSSPVLPRGFLWRFFLPCEIFFKSE